MSPPLFDVSELIALESDLGKVPGAAVGSVTTAAVASGNILRETWAANVAATGGSHLPHLPAAITVEPKVSLGSIGVQVGPESGKLQGRLGKGDEYGSVNTPAHMNGHKAADTVEPQFVKATEAAVLKAMGPVSGRG